MNEKDSKKKDAGRKRKVLAVVLCAILAIGCVAGGAIAKYTTSVSGGSTATVAKWMFEVNDVNMTPLGESAEMTFDLFGTVKDTEGNAEEDVKTGLIAPGTSGAFDIKIENLSEVNATYALDFSIVNNDAIPLQFSTDGGKTWKTFDKLDELDIPATELAMETGTTTVTVDWRWVFDNGADEKDTALGIAAQTKAPTVEVTCAATFTQVD